MAGHRDRTIDWREDDEIQRALAEQRVRRGLWRSAIIWTPLFLVAGAAWLFFLADELTGGERGGWFLIVVLTIFCILFGTQSIQAIRDLRSKPTEVEGVITRRWTRSDSLVLRSHYLRIEGKLLRGDLDLIADVKAGDFARVRFYPHSAVITDVQKLQQPAGAAGDEEDDRPFQ
jgi:hypothetical protein